MFSDSRRVMVKVIVKPVVADTSVPSDMRLRRAELLRRYSFIKLQKLAVETIASAAEAWLATRASANDDLEPFPSSMVWISLEPLLRSLTERDLWSLIDSEGMRDISGRDVIGHIIASTTPLVAVTSIIRALLVGSGSIVKLPGAGPGGWLQVFLNLLIATNEDIASLIEVYAWPRTDEQRNRWLYNSVDLVVVYGDNHTIASVTSQSRVPVVPYGHRISAAVIPFCSVQPEQYDGLAMDILMYDQGGCLSVHTVFVEGDLERVQQQAQKLSDALSRCPLPSPAETMERSASVNEARSLLAMDPAADIAATEGSRWTVVVYEESDLIVSATHGIVYVVHGSKAGIIEVVKKSSSRIQGVSLACGGDLAVENWISDLHETGISYVCRAGELESPNIHWREDGRDLLRSLV